MDNSIGLSGFSAKKRFNHAKLKIFVKKIKKISRTRIILCKILQIHTNRGRRHSCHTRPPRLSYNSYFSYLSYFS